VVADISYTANASEVGRLIKANPDALMHASYITDDIRVTRTFKAMGFNPKDMLTSRFLLPAWEGWDDGR
jgi:hypothetical protein